MDKVFAGQEAGLNAGARTKLQTFRDTLAKIRHAATTLPVSEALRVTMEESGLLKHYGAQPEDGEERVGNMQELVNLAVRFDDEVPEEGIERLLEEAALQSEQDNHDSAQNAVSLMTVHASKGLEFDAVFVTGLEQGLFPHEGYGRDTDDDRDPEEERRLFYVAMTRARKRLFLSYADERARFGERERTLPSEFVADIDERLLRNLAPGKTAPTTPRKRGLLDDWEDVIT
jgi:DNA helicase-2/ATP-dependent DNA helicase PcrA